ncbi:type IV pilus biogenesis/stability protein PilW [Alteromonas pelagimontana]|uniref:Type IV pilus biogenesis/stability protein PilW n=1 Tax=Alteromonas pelagimontana TaxID=1858656 RepID=A0A6M4MFZ9_9ALTE|nr:type IV pilus biogenesis/stability protein PilW [Alteromonas pelagimontana]QJR82039.1 type IV pilus biogenesis/stability protein PilW [Alteromonas pelagimontana]
MRLGVIALVVFLTGCVSQSLPDNFPGSDNFDMQEAAKSRISLGLTYLTNGNYPQAKMNLDKALEFAPRLADTHYALAYYYQTVEEAGRAEEFYNNALKLDPRNADIANSYGTFLCQQGRYKDATEYFLKAINNKSYAGFAETYENMALCARGQGANDDAIEYLQNALNHQPTRAKSLFLLTELYIDTQQWDKAQQTLRKYDKVARVSPESIGMAMDIAEGKGDLATAHSYGEMLITMYPDSALAKAYSKKRAEQSDREQKMIRRAKPRANHNAPAQALDETELPSPGPAPEPAQVAIASVKKKSTLNSDNDRKSLYHVVEWSENLYRISVKYNIKMTSLQSWNNLRDAGDIHTGMKLWLVPPEQRNN